MAARATAGAPSPTVDLYFLNAFGDRVGQDRPVRRLAPTVFATQDAVLAIRHDLGARFGRAERRRLIYVLDDAIFAGLHDTSLPLSYRMKLAMVDCRAARRLLPRADAVVVSRPEVVEALPRGLIAPGAEIVLVDPYWSEALPDLAHFHPDGPIDAAFTGARTHASDLKFVARAAAEFLDAEPRARLHLAANHSPPAILRRHLRCRPFAETRWTEYRCALGAMRRWIALYPLGDGPFARARSANKLTEHALMGAAGLYAEGWAPGRAAAAAGAGLALPRDPRAWREAMAALAAAPDVARAMAEAGAALARARNVAAPQQTLWARLLGVGPGAAAEAAA